MSTNRTPEDETRAKALAKEKVKEELRNIWRDLVERLGFDDQDHAEDLVEQTTDWILTDRKAQATALLEKVDTLQHPAFPQMGLMLRLYDVRSIIKEVGGLGE